MGTRNLTIVFDQTGELKVAQYGQWDGYPSGVGVDTLRILKDKDLFVKFKENLRKVRFLDPDGVDKEFMDNFDRNWGKSNHKSSLSPEQLYWFETYITRDLDVRVLTNIANAKESQIILDDAVHRGDAAQWVEYTYIINLKENTFGVHNHPDEAPLKVYSLDELPEEADFIDELKSVEKD